jgi:uncharacterized membrane protein
MNRINKALIAPIIALVLIYCKSVAGIELPDDTADIVTDAVLSIIALVGIFTKPTKDDSGDSL